MRQVTLLDGSIGQELVVRAGKKPRAIWSTEVLLEQPELVRQVHTEYFRAGAGVGEVGGGNAKAESPGCLKAAR